MIPHLSELSVRGRIAHFAHPEEGRAASFFLVVHRPAADGEGLCDGERLAVCAETDAEPGDLVVWWAGRPGTEALARLGEDLSLHPVGGFPPPGAQGRLRIRGVVVGRLRQDRSHP